MAEADLGKNPPRVILVDSIGYRPEYFKIAIERETQYQAFVDIVSTELGFRNRLEAHAAESTPHIVILDHMQKWTDPAPDIQEPPLEVREGGFIFSGLRMINAIQKNPGTADWTIVLKTMIDPRDTEKLLAEDVSKKYGYGIPYTAFSIHGQDQASLNTEDLVGRLVRSIAVGTARREFSGLLYKKPQMQS